jgi:hypothetical protein
MRITLTEIIDRSSEGATRPFFCKCDDGFSYYVKGNFAGRRTLVSEWIAGRIGRTLGLRLPEIRIIEIPPSFLRYSARDDINELGAMPAFGSRYIDNPRAFNYSDIDKVPQETRSKVLFFDWWIANRDRTLSMHSGNPNLIVSSNDDTLWIIDHNQSFYEESLATFWETHVFADKNFQWSSAFIHEMKNQMQLIYQNIEQFWAEIPDEWIEMDAGLSLKQINQVLLRMNANGSDFWRIK